MLKKKYSAQFKKRIKAFWDRDFIGRPFISATYPNPDGMRADNEFTYVNCLKNVMEGNYLEYAKMYERVANSNVYEAEAVPSFQCDISSDQFAGFFGSKIIGREGEYTTWSAPCREDLDFVPTLDESENGYYSKLKEFMKNVSEYAGDNYLVNTLDSHSNLDTLSSLRGPQNFCLDFFDAPELIHKTLDVINGYYGKIYDEIYYSAGMDKKGTSCWLPAYSEKKYNVVQCDFSCMISPETVREYLIPSLEIELSHLDRAIYHYDGKGALGHLDYILALEKINCIQWVPGDGEKRTIEWMDLLKKIQKAGKSLWISDWSQEEVLADRELDPSKVMFVLRFESEKEYECFMKKLWNKYNS